MNGGPVFLLLLSLKIICLQANQRIIVSNNNYLHKINSQLHSLTNKIYHLLNLGKEFSKNDKVKVLLTMHNDLKKISERHGKIYDNIINIANFTDSSKTPSLGKVLEDIVTEETDRIQNFSIKTTAKRNETLNTILGRVVNEMLDVIFSVDGIIMPSINNRVNKNKNKKHTMFSRRSNVRNIKIWHPPLSIELNDTRRLYKGKKTRIKKFPFLASIHVMNRFMCAGSIISKDLVITAATCLQIAYKNPHYSHIYRYIFARVGSDYIKRNGELIPIIDLYFHPEFDPVSLKNNLVIVRLMQRPRSSRKRQVQRIQYDDRIRVDSDEIDVVTVLGWGDKSNEHRTFYQKQKVSIAQLDMYEIEACKEIYSQYYVTDSNFCAGFESKGGGACNKDVGGPAIVYGELIGIISFGPPVCGMSNSPTVFTKVGYYVDWINYITDVIYQKADMRHVKIPMGNAIPPVFTTPSVADLATKNMLHQLASPIDEELDEINLLQEILQEMIFTNDSVLDYILYGDLQTNDIAVTTTNGEFHQMLSNTATSNSLLVKGNHINFPRNDVGGSSYEDSDIEIKVLESFVSQTQSTTELITFTNKIFGVKTSSELQQQTVNTEEFVDTDKQQNNVDLSSYYEDDENSYEGYKNQKTTPRMPATKETNRQYREATTPKSKNIKFEDFKHVMFKLNPFKESRSIITDSGDNKSLENTSKNRRGKRSKDKSSMQNDKRYMERQTDKQNEDVGRAVDISDEDYGFDVDTGVKEHFDKIKRHIDRSAIYWKS